MPFAGFNDFNDCKETMMNEEGHDKESAEKICGALESENEKDEGKPKELLNEIMDGAKQILNDLTLENFSFVDEPAQPSHFTRMKSNNDDNNKFEITNKLVTKKSEKDDWSVIYGAVMIPNVTDKQGDIITREAIERAAHNFVKEKKTDEIDGDHNLITNKGNLVESWLLEEEKEYKSINDETVTYPAGTWMAGVEPNDEAKRKIESAEWKGFSIYGQAEGVEVNESKQQKNNSKQENVDTVPTDEIASNAEQALDKYDDSDIDNDDCGTRTGLERANQLSNKEDLSAETINRMVSFFSRHDGNQSVNEGIDNKWEDCGYLTWELWGGDAGRDWAERKQEQLEDENNKESNKESNKDNDVEDELFLNKFLGDNMDEEEFMNTLNEIKESIKELK